MENIPDLPLENILDNLSIEDLLNMIKIKDKKTEVQKRLVDFFQYDRKRFLLKLYNKIIDFEGIEYYMADFLKTEGLNVVDYKQELHNKYITQYIKEISQEDFNKIKQVFSREPSLSDSVYIYSIPVVEDRDEYTKYLLDPFYSRNKLDCLCSCVVTEEAKTKLVNMIKSLDTEYKQYSREKFTEYTQLGASGVKKMKSFISKVINQNTNWMAKASLEKIIKLKIDYNNIFKLNVRILKLFIYE